jgi:hypothetical protein
LKQLQLIQILRINAAKPADAEAAAAKARRINRVVAGARSRKGGVRTATTVSSCKKCGNPEVPRFTAR